MFEKGCIRFDLYKKQKCYKIFFVRATNTYNLFNICHHWSRKSYTIRKNGTNAKLMWVPRGTKIKPQGPKKVWVSNNVNIADVIDMQDANTR